MPPTPRRSLELVAVGEDLAGHHGVVLRRPTCRRCPCRCAGAVVVVGSRSCRCAVGAGRSVVPVSVVRSSVVVGVGGLGGRSSRWSSCRSSSVSVVRRRLGLRLLARRGDPLAQVADARLQAVAQLARRPSRAASSSSFWALATACAAAVQWPASVVGRDLVQRRSSRLDASPAGISAPSPPQATSTAAAGAAARGAASSRQQAHAVTDRTAGARRASRAGGRRGSPPAAPAMSYSARRQSAVQALGVEQQPGGARVAVARLADAARVDQPLAARQMSSSSPLAARRAGRRLALRAVERERDVRVADQRDALRLWRRGTARRAGRRGRTPRPGRAARRGRARRPRAALRAAARAGTRACSGVDRPPASSARRARRRARSPRATSTPATARSWLPARQIAAVLARQRDAGVGVGAVADEVAQAPQLVGAGAPRRRRAPPRRRGGCRGCRRRWRPHAAASLVGAAAYERGAACRVAVAVVAAVGRRGGRGAAPAAARRRLEPVAVDAASLLQPARSSSARATSARPARRSSARSTAIEVGAARAGSCAGRRRGCAGPSPARCWPARRPARRCRWRWRVATLPVRADRAPARRRTSGWSPSLGRLGRATSPSRTAIGAVLRRRGGALLVVAACAASPRAGGSPARRSSSRFGVGRRPTPARSCSTRSSTASRRCPTGRTRTDVLELAREAGVDVGEVYEVDAARRTTAANAYVNGLGHTKRVVLYDTLLQGLHAAPSRGSSSPTSSATSATATCRAGCSTSRSSRPSAMFAVARADASAWRRASAGPARPRCRPLALSLARSSARASRSSPTSSRAASRRAPTRSRSS